MALALGALFYHKIAEEFTFSTNALVVSFEDALFSLKQVAGVEDTLQLPLYALLPHHYTLGSLVSAFVVVDGLCKREFSFQVLAELHVLFGLIITMVLLQDLLEALLGALNQVILLVDQDGLIGQANHKEQPGYPLLDV